LRELARTGLNGLRSDRYELIFRALADELPDETWGTVRVNPLDAALAGMVFPSVVIESVAGIAGGFEVATADGDFTVINTLDVRLERAWPDLLPEMVSELRGRAA
jgi:V/A-type H+-transporting ATPase subunit E